MSKKQQSILGIFLISLCLLLAYSVIQAGVRNETSQKTGLAYRTLAEADGEPMAVTTGMVFDLLTQEYLPHSHYSYYKTYSDCLAALEAGKVDGFFCDEPVAREICRHHSDVGYIKGVPDPDLLAIGINPRRPELKLVLDEGIDRYEKNGTLQAINAIWFGDDEDQKKMPQPQVGYKGTVVCSVFAESAPLGYVRDDRVVGYEADLVMRILQEAGYTVQLHEADFMSLMPSLVSGKADLIMGTVSITKERQTSVLFSKPIYRSDVVLMVKNYGGAGDESFFEDMEDSLYKTFVLENRYRMIGDGMKITILITVGASLLGILFGFLVCILLRSSITVLSLAARLFVQVMQGMPLVVFLMIAYYIIFAKSTFSPVYIAILAFAINMSADISKMMVAGIESVDRGQLEAAYAMGFTRMQTLVRIMAPQVVRYMLPFYTSAVISTLKMTAVVGYIAIQDLTKMGDIIRSRTYDAFFPLIVTALLYLLAAWFFSWGLHRLGCLLDPKKRSRTLKGVKG